MNTETYQFAYTDMRKMEGMDLHARVATLVSPEDHSHEFMATVANNAGLDVNLFTNAEEAIHFLPPVPFPVNLLRRMSSASRRFIESGLPPKGAGVD